MHEQHGTTIALGDMSTSNGSDPAWWARNKKGKLKDKHHKGHGHNGRRSGQDIDFRYVSTSGRSFQSSTATTDPRYSQELNQALYNTSSQFGFNANYEGTSGPDLDNARRVGGHNNHGHLGYGDNGRGVSYTVVGKKNKSPKK